MAVLIKVCNLKKTFRFREGLFRRYELEAVQAVSFNLLTGQTLAIIGTNGSGKSTLVCMLSGVIKPTSGEIFFTDIILSMTIIFIVVSTFV